MYRKIISVMSVALVVFLCFQFPAFAVTGGGKTIVSNSYSYNNGDVTVYVRVNGQAAEELYEGQHYYPHNFTVTLANNTNQFQVADVNNFSIDLYSGSGSTFASNQNAWGAEVTSYSDNMTVPRITMYPSGDLAGHVLVAFNDSDLLVLNPNETRTYNFSINFIQTENINYTPLNGNYRYSYFTYTGTVGFYARPTSFSTNTIADFINNDSLPNSVIAYYQALLSQGVEDQELYQNIIDILTYNGSITNPVDNSPAFTTFINQNVSSVRLFGRRLIGNRKLIDSTVVLDPSNDTQYTLYSYEVPVMVSIYIDNLRNYQVRNNGINGYISLNFGGNNYTIEQFSSTLFSGIQFLSQNTINLYGKYLAYDVANNPLVIPKGRYTTFIIVNYHYQTTDPNYNYVIPNFIIDNFPTDFIEYNSVDYDYNDTTVFTKIKMKIQDILDSYNANAPAAQDVTDTSEDTQDIVSDQHDIESGYFEDTQTYITDTGIQNFQFDPAITGGLGGVKDDFTAVWTSCGTLAQYWIASLTIGLALSIIRHRRMFSK